jgi:hypothetical protein
MGRRETQIRKRRGLETQSTRRDFFRLGLAFLVLIVGVFLMGLALREIARQVSNTSTPSSETVES